MAVLNRQSITVDFFLIAHDPFDDGRLRIGPELFGCGLVGAKLAELVMARRLGVDGGEIVVLDATEPQDDGDDYVLENVAGQSTAHSVKSWIEPLQDGLYDIVARQLVMAGVVRRQAGVRRFTRGGRHPDRFPANDLLVATRPQQDLEQLLRTPRDLTLAAGVLAALIGAVGLDGSLNLQLDRSYVRELLTEIEQNLPTDLFAVCESVRATTAEVSLRAR